jgi:hypothetical protein
MMRRAADSYAGSIRLRPEAAEAMAALVRPLGAFERLYHLRQQKNTMHFCMVAELAANRFRAPRLDPAIR